MGCRHRPYHTVGIATALAFLLFASASAFLHTPHQLDKRPVNRIGASDEIMERLLTRRQLIGPGSSPPSCRSKCGHCAPCRPVHVPITPGLNRPLEYYPEAWRCKCGYKIFMP